MEEIDKIKEELDELGSNLAKFKKNRKRNNMELYFEEMQQKVFNRLHDTSINEVPEGYFNTLPQEVINKASKRETRTFSLIPYIKWVAASLIIIAGVSFFFNNYKSTTLAEAELSEEEIEYIIDKFNTEEDFEYIKQNIETEAEATTNDEIEYIIEDEEIEILNDII